MCAGPLEEDGFAMEQWTKVCGLEEVLDGYGLRCDVAGAPALAVFNAGGNIHVIDDKCSHGDASLSDGWVEGEEIECPFHAARFCLRTGAALTMPADVPVRVWRSRVVDGQVEVDLSAPAPAA